VRGQIPKQISRIAFSVLRIDASLSILLDHPPSIRFQEVCIPLPKSSDLWTAATEEDRRRLQWNEPAGREKALFCFILRDALDPNHQSRLACRLTGMDYHLGLCAMQSGTWEAAREAHSAASDELAVRSSPENSVRTWENLLNRWRASMENDIQVSSVVTHCDFVLA
jgi:hypothetical protein